MSNKRRVKLAATLGFIALIQHYLMRRGSWSFHLTEFIHNNDGPSRSASAFPHSSHGAPSRQHDHNITTSSTKSLRSAGLDDNDDDKQRRPFVWYLHFHKSAGSSFTELAFSNQERVRHAQFLNSTTIGTDRHGHLELDARSVFRWDLLGGLHASSCELPPRTSIEQEQVRLLHEEITMLQQHNISFASTEHWFPSQNVMSQLQRKLDRPIITVVVLRHPLERLWSSYHFHGNHGGRCPPFGKRWVRKRACQLDEWSKGESNMYVSMLNGLPFGPGKIDNHCTSQMRNVTLVDYERAVAALDQFDLVLTLESLQQKQKDETTTITGASCALHQVLGWEVTRLPKANVAKRKMMKRTNQKESQEKQQQKKEVVNATTTISTQHPKVKADNLWDLKLYEYAKKLESQHFAKLQCG